MVFIKGSSNNKGSDASVIFENSSSLVVEIFVWFEFLTTNNQAEYEVVIVGITLAGKVGARYIKLQMDFQLVVSKIRREALTKDL